MIETHLSRALLHLLAERFERTAVELDGQCWAWGQFLDATKRDDHVGTYGSSAGIIVLALAERGDSIYLSGALRKLREWWTAGNPPNHSNPNTLYARERLVQTLRLAFMYVATRSLVHSDAVAISNELKEALFSRILRSGLWGNYWLDETRHDQTPRWFTSAIVLLSFALTRDESEPLDDQLLTAANRLENHLVSARPIGSSSFRAAEQAAIGAALLAIPERSIGLRARRKLNRLARSFSQWRAERTPFFYSYELPDDAPGRFRDEYFIVPTEILLAIAGCQRRAPGYMQLAAERILRSVQKNIEDNGAYNPDWEQPVFSVDQAWAAVLLRQAAAAKRPSLWVRPVYSLLRERRGNWFTRWAFPVFAVLFVTSSNVILAGADPWMRVVAAVAVLVIGGIYGSAVFRPTREDS